MSLDVMPLDAVDAADDSIWVVMFRFLQVAFYASMIANSLRIRVYQPQQYSWATRWHGVRRVAQDIGQGLCGVRW